MTPHPAQGHGPHFTTLVECLRTRAATTPEEIAYTFCGDEESDELQVTYRELDRRARAVAAALQRLNAEGERAVLLYPPSLDYVATFLGCLYAKVIAVPAYPPDVTRLNRSLPRLQAILDDAGATLILTTEMIQSMSGMLEEYAPNLRELRWVATDVLEPGTEEGWREPEVTAETLAFLQYTSGSTGMPKGVMLSHSNLVHNSHLIGVGFELRRGSVAVNWLPPYHDMGLIGGILQPLYNGFHGVLLSPLTFLHRPLRWLQAISRHHGTCAGGPNFAFDLCVRKIKPEEREGLDLRTWDVAFCGAEPIRPETLERFAKAFAPQGFQPEAFYPCYGLAEATLFAAGGRKVDPVRVGRFQATQLQAGRAQLSSSGAASDIQLVSSGTTLPWQSIVIADPATGTPCPQGSVGEIWMSGPSVAHGYWKRPEDTQRTFNARLSTGEGPFLRTGDLGFLLEDQLFITGRHKDLIIIRGRNHYPQDIERTVEESSTAVRSGCSAAFSVDIEGEERLVLTVEANARQEVDADALATTLRQAIAEQHQLGTYAVLVLKPGAIPKTSSGKIQRHACRQGFLEGTLELLGEWRNTGTAEEQDRLSLEEAPAPALSSPESVREWLRARAARLLHVSPEELDPSAPLTRYGLDSLQSLELHAEIERTLGVALPLTALIQGNSIEELVAQLPAAHAAPARRELLAPAPDTQEAQPLSHGQRALWFLHELAPHGTAYHVARAVRLRSEVEPLALRRAFQALVDRHPSLRTRFTSVNGEPRQHVLPRAEVSFHHEDVTGIDEVALQARVAEAAHRPFALQSEPPLRVHLWTRAGAEPVLLLAMHHLITDFWSLAVMVQELGTLYAAARRGTDAVLPPLPLRYTDYARAQQATLASTDAEPSWNWWREQLGGSLPVLELPTDRPRPPVQSFRGGARNLRLGRDLTRALHALARAHDTTLYTVLVAAFHTLLHRYTGQDDLIVGSPTSGRTRAGLSSLVGYFTNPVALRARLSPGMSFEAVLRQVRGTVRSALEHQEIPFPALVERLQPQRDPSRSPIFQAMLVLQKSHLAAERGLEALALGESGTPVDVGGLLLEAFPLEQRGAQFDLSLALAETSDGLAASMGYSTDLFDAGTIERMLGHLRVLLEGITANPACPVAALPMLSEAERAQLARWNATATPYEGAATLHGLFEAQVERTPDAVALVFEGQELSYRELERRANQLAHHLRGLGVGPEVRVGLCLERSLELVVGLLGVLKAGGAYVPLDPGYPRERLEYMLRDAAVPVLLTQQRLRELLPAQGPTRVCLDSDWEAIARAPAEPLAVDVSGDTLAYVIYTSGSTGRPKGAMNTHAGVRNRLLWMQAVQGLGASDRVLQKTPFSFDVSVWEFFLPLLSGARLVLARPGGHQDPAYLRDLITRQGITLAHFVPSMLQAFLEEPGLEACTSLRQLVCSGEALSPELRDRCLARLGIHALHNLYGPTEAAVDVSMWICHRGDSSRVVPIGRPIANTRLHVLDERLEPLPVGVPGELYIGGIQVGRGYLGRPDLTAERFLPEPSGEASGARLYRTGDRARRLPGGDIEYLGRLDHQVKLRGFRIELGEIESVLAQHPGVREVAVLARRDAPGDARLVAYVVPAHEPAPESAELRAFLKERLPEYSVPSAFVRMQALPLNPSGKLDRRALPAPRQREESPRAFVAPHTPTEEMLAGIWAQVLRVERVSTQDNFFELGGHSLLATQVVSRLRSALGHDVPLSLLFEAPTVAALAERLGRLLPSESGTAAPPIGRTARDASLPLSFAQERLWFLAQLDGPSPAYNVPARVHVDGTLDVAALEQSLRDLIQRHESLRTTFQSVDGHATQRISPDVELSFRVEDLRHLPASQREAEAQRLATQEALLPFELSRGPLLRARLVRLDEREHELLLTLHHIVSDGWSLRVLVRELCAFYPARLDGQPARFEELPVQYADFSVWQRRWLQGPALESQLAHWKAALAGLNALELPTDRPRPAVRTLRGARRALALPAGLSRELRALSQREDVTLFMTLMAGFQALLSRYTGQEDFAVGTDVANRNHGAVEGLIGFFVNQLVLRADLSGDPTFRELLARTRRTALAAYTHQDVPFEALVSALRPERDRSRTPLFQVKFILDNEPLETLELPGARLTTMKDVERGTSPLDLTLALVDRPEGLSGTLEYSTDLFDAGTAERLSRHLVNLLQAAVAEPSRRLSQLSLMDAAQTRALLVDWNATAAHYPADLPVHRLFEAHAARTPEAVALRAGDTTVTYGELERRSNQLARHLRTLGIRPGHRVALCLEPTAEMVVAVLGVLKAGATYVPIEPSYPMERIGFMLADARPTVLLTVERIADELPATTHTVCLDSDAPRFAALPGDAPGWDVPPESPAYIIYTSGSTGRPKGVMVSHRGLSNYLAWASRAYAGAEGSGSLVHSPLSFDLTVTSLFVPLINGRSATLVPSGPGVEGLAAALRAGDALTLLKLTPAHLDALRQTLSPDEVRGRVLTFVIGGEALTNESLSFWRRHAPGTRLINEYGPTETVVGCCIFEAPATDEASGPVPIGRPIANTRLYVLDRFGQPVPPGAAGELFIGGDGVALGYWGRPELTAERFVPDSFSGIPGARLYRTGDLVRLRPDGELLFLGRADHQVKLRGFRIELGEIEAVLAQHPEVREAVVDVREEPSGARRLVGYVVCEGHAEQALASLQEHLRRSLPEYMVPSVLVPLEALPLNTHGKVDRRALPAPELLRPGRSTARPETDEEELLTAVFAEALGLEHVGVEDDFFELGGDSIRGIPVVAGAAKSGLHFTLSQLFQHHTPRELARVVRREASAEQVPPSAPFSLLSEEDRRLLPEGLEDAYPVTALQAGMLFHSAADGDATVYHNVNRLRLRGHFDQPSLERTLAELAARHAGLRTSFHLAGYGQPLQFIHRDVVLPLEVRDLRRLPSDEQEAAVAQWMEAERSARFNWARPPLIRFTLLLLGEDTFEFGWTEHHAIGDGWSINSLLVELFERYLAHARGTPLPVEPPPTASFRDFVHLEAQAARSDASRAFWLARLEESTATTLPRWSARAPGEGTPRLHKRSVVIPAELSSALKQVAQRARVPLKSVLLAAHCRVMALLSGGEDVVTGLISNGRPETPDGDRVFGLFLNTVPFRQRLPDTSWLELIQDTFRLERELLAHRRYPLAQLQRALGGVPLFETSFNFTHFHVFERLRSVEGLELLDASDFNRTSFALHVEAGLHYLTSEVRLQLCYDPGNLPDEQMEAVAGYYARVLERIAREPAARHRAGTLLSEQELRTLLGSFNDTRTDFPGGTVHGLFEAQLARTPDAMALTFEGATLTYRELGARVHRLARELRTLGVGPEVPVGVCLERSFDLVVGLLAILEAGGAYVPLEPALPPERLAAMLEDAGAALTLTHARFAERLPASAARLELDTRGDTHAPFSDEPLPEDVDAGSLAYIIFTSGSTGRPKGAMNAHRGVVNRLRWMQARHPIGPGASVLQKTPFGFDVSVWEFFWPLMSGARLVLARPEGHKDPGYLVRLIRQEGITHAHFVPSMFQAFLDHPEADTCESLLEVFCSGEALPYEQQERFFQLFAAGLHNFYGPTEAAVEVTAWTCERDGTRRSVPIGRPVPNTTTYVLDARREPLPVGVPGELYLGGIQVGRGYRGRPDLTAERFVPDPFSSEPGARLYRTGDLCCFLEDGTLEYLGRIDHQVKLRGFRIELGEIESVLRGHPVVREAVVMLRKDGGEPRLVGYVVAGLPVEREPRHFTLRVERAGDEHLELSAQKAPAMAEPPPPGGVTPETELRALAEALKSPGQGHPLLISALRAYLRQKLPEYMVPSALLILEALPLTASGKVDRRALPAPEAPTDAKRAAYVAPSSELEQLIAEVWRQELHMEQVGRDDNFFDLGGTSLLATRVQVALQQKLGRELSLVALFTYPTVALLAKHLSEPRDAPPALARVEGEAQRQKEGLGRLKRMAKRMKSDE